MAKKYNLIIITLDGARIDRIKNMPNFKKLAFKSTLFSQVITYAPYTIASMHATFTGAYGNRNGVDNYYGARLFKKDSFITLTSYLKKENYYTFGDLLSELIVPLNEFDEFKIHNELKDNLTERHLEFITDMDKIRKKQNFFLYLHYSNIHTGILLNVLKKYNNFSKDYFNQKEENLKAYDSYLKEADKYLGALMGKIDSLDMVKDTLIVVLSDHGISVGENFGERAYGAFCYDYTVKAFTLFYQPTLFPRKEIASLVRTVDTLPTLLDYLGIKQDPEAEKIDGKSMRTFLEGKDEERTAFIEAGNPLKTNEPPKKPNCRAIRTSKWKFIHNYWDDSEELYNLKKDPQEKKNLINTERKIARELREKLNKELRRGFELKLKSIKNLGKINKSS